MSTATSDRATEVMALIAIMDDMPEEGLSQEELKAWADKWMVASRAYCQIVTPKYVANLLSELRAAQAEVERLRFDIAVRTPHVTTWLGACGHQWRKDQAEDCPICALAALASASPQKEG